MARFLSSERRAKRKAWKQAYYEKKRGTKLCVNCHGEIPIGSHCRKYCPECAIELHGPMVLAGVVHDAREQFSQLAEVNPVEAEKILSEIEGEEGPGFREVLLDGIPEKLKLNGGH
jgi:hypothetical protein